MKLIALLLTLSGCAHLGPAVQFSGCVIADEKLSGAVKDPQGAAEYLKTLAEDLKQGKRLDEAGDLAQRLSNCIQQ